MMTCMCFSEECRRNGCQIQQRSPIKTGAAVPNIGSVKHFTIGGIPNGLPVVQPTFPPQPVPAAAPKPPVQRGWECPRCGAILAPHVDRCTCLKVA